MRDQILGTLFQRAEQYRREVEAQEVVTQQMLEEFQENMISDATLMVHAFHLDASIHLTPPSG